MIRTLTRSASLGLALGLAIALAACQPGDTSDLSNDSPQETGLTIPEEKLVATQLAAACSGCHAPLADPEAAIPSLAGRSREELATVLSQYRTEVDGTTVMHRLMRGYRQADIDLIAAYLGAEQ